MIDNDGKNTLGILADFLSATPTTVKLILVCRQYRCEAPFPIFFNFLISLSPVQALPFAGCSPIDNDERIVLTKAELTIS